MALAIGDTVMLKSENLVMTVTNINGSGEVQCTWYSQIDGYYRKHEFPTAALESAGNVINDADHPAGVYKSR